MPKFLSNQKTVRYINIALNIVSILFAIFLGSRVREDLLTIAPVRDFLVSIGGADNSVVGMLVTAVITIIAVFIGYFILKLAISLANTKDRISNGEIQMIYLVSSIVAMTAGIFSGFAGGYRVMVTTVVHVIVVFILANLMLRWKKANKESIKKINIYLVVYAIVLLVISLPMVRQLILPA